MSNRSTLLLPLLALLLACASAPHAAPEIVIAPGSAVTTDQLRALREALTAHPHADWVEIREMRAQIVESSGRTTFLWAEALHTPHKVSGNLCHGRLTLFSMRDESFDTNTWQPHENVLYATYDPAGIDACAHARDRDRRFRFAGVSLDELAGVLEVFTGPAPQDESALGPATLMSDERISQVKKKPTSPNKAVIEVHTVKQRGDHGRVIEFEMREGVWVGRVTGGWIA